ncbi:predicted protein [Sclerotinia sclerotiorum 1980 UF-70]|uniref:Uncharacterized protein n=1 Tax=Sclerotinia sclerotiorum (strain ATCC 18683 / 1980 / Ss-1) TaxID=665079 RepID=A7E592_SCLS1|nr:predicted protein [Sclerotinia sclerotiorum 1980 UF-70]EDN91064.1 predicted protein [Sclerotinia sclerotiorum 1980 UF-70]
MAFNAEGTPNVPRNRIRLRQCQLYMEGRIGGSAQNTPNEIYTSKPPVGHLPRHNNHMHQPAPFTADDMGTYGQNFSNQMAPNGPRPPFIPINSSHLNGTADYTARKISGIHHFYLNQMVPSPSPSPPSSSLTRNIRMFSLRYSTQMHMAPSFPPLGHMHDPRSINELSFDNPRGVRDSGHFSPSSSLSNNNGQGLNPVSAINNNGQGFNPVSAINNNEQDPHPVTLHRREQAQNPPTQSQHTLHNTPSPPPPPIPQTAPSVSPLPAPPKFALRTRELDVAGHMGSGIEGVRRTSDRMSPSGDVGVQVLEARRRRDRWGGAGTGRSTRKEDFPSNGAANWWA